MTAVRVFKVLLITRLLLPFAPMSVDATKSADRPPVLHIVALAIVVFDIVATVGLWQFQPWARIGAIVLAFTTLAFAFCAVHPGFVTHDSLVLTYLWQFSTGAVFAMMFLPPLSLEFARSKPNPANDGPPCVPF